MQTVQAVKPELPSRIITSRRDAKAFQGWREVMEIQHLTEKLEAIVKECSALDGAVRIEVLAACKASLSESQQIIRERFEAGLSGRETKQAIAWSMDQLIRALYKFIVGHVYQQFNPTSGERLSVIAVGGYGRGEMAPYSDVDLLFLFPYRQTPWG